MFSGEGLNIVICVYGNGRGLVSLSTWKCGGGGGLSDFHVLMECIRRVYISEVGGGRASLTT